MEDYRDLEIRVLRRQLKGLPPLKETVLPADCLLTVDEVAKKFLTIFKK